MAIRVACGCGQSFAVKDEFAGKRGRCPVCRGVVLVPPAAATPVPAVPEPEPEGIDSQAVRPASSVEGVHLFREMPVGRLIALSVFTLNVGATIYLNLLHGKMPPRRRDDPSAARAIGFLFIPFFNLYWFFFTYLRLLTRVNELRAFYGLPPLRLVWLVVLLFVLMVIPYAGLLNLLFFVPLFITRVQSGINALVEVSAARDRDATAPLRAELRAGRDLRRAWGWYFAVLGGVVFLVAAGGSLAADGSTLSGLVRAAVLGLVLPLPLALGGATAFWRAARMGRALDRLERDPAAVEEVRASERRATARVRLAWGVACLAMGGLQALAALAPTISEAAERGSESRRNRAALEEFERDVRAGEPRPRTDEEMRRIEAALRETAPEEESPKSDYPRRKRGLLAAAAEDLLPVAPLVLAWLAAGGVLLWLGLKPGRDGPAELPTGRGGGSYPEKGHDRRPPAAGPPLLARRHAPPRPPAPGTDPL